jgi:pterin-4a-carbinolamine dehydratase
VQPFTFFVSYRRQDTAPIALLLKSEIEKRLQFVRVIVDVEDMHPGDDFPERIRNFIEGAHATIVLIGKNWMPRRDRATPARGKAIGRRARRGDGRASDIDWVRSELEISKRAPLAHAKADRYGSNERWLLPLFIDCDMSFGQFELPSSLGHVTTKHAQRIDYASWPQDIGPIIQSWAVKLKLHDRPERDEYPEPSPAKARTQPVDEQELATILNYDDYEGWYVDNFGDGKVRYLVKKFPFNNFNQAARFMSLVSDHCKMLNHHPEWRNVFKHVTVSLTTWDAGRRVTIYDLNLALFMNKAAEAVLTQG